MAITPAGLAAFVEYGRVIEVHPNLFGLSAAVERQFLVLVGERTAVQSDPHYIVIEIGDFRPAFSHLAAKQSRVAATGKD